MLRAVVESVGLFIAPFLLFVVYLVLRARYPLAVAHWTRSRIATLTLLGLAAVVVGLIGLTLTAPRGQGTYVRAQVVKGKLVPGHFE